MGWRGPHGGAASKNTRRLEGDQMKSEIRNQKSEIDGIRHLSLVTRYLAIYGALWKTSVTREMSFKGNFLLWILVELLWFGLQLAFVSVIFSQTSTVGTWTVWQGGVVLRSARCRVA